MMKDIEDKFQNPQFIGTKLNYENKEYIVKEADNYSYTDPVDNSVANKQVNLTKFLSLKKKIFNLQRFWEARRKKLFCFLICKTNVLLFNF